MHFKLANVGCWFIQGYPSHTQDHPVFVYSKARCWSEAVICISVSSLTPANTLVISKTLIPARGSKDASSVVAVAKRLLERAFGRLGLIHSEGIWSILREDLSNIINKTNASCVKLKGVELTDGTRPQDTVAPRFMSASAF